MSIYTRVSLWSPSLALSISARLALSLGFALMVACVSPNKALDGESVDSAGAAGPADTSGALDGQEAGEDVSIWASDGPCVPECVFAKRCEGGVCVHRTCTEDVQCNPIGGSTDGEQPWFCFHGKCQAYQCGQDSDCPKGQACNLKISRCYLLPTGCTTHASCDDANPCTADTCDQISGKCAHKAVANCCQKDSDCASSSKCIVASCQAGKCVFAGVNGCCTLDAECFDGHPCTTDTCAQGGKCVFKAQPGCCEVDGACDDDNPLSVDTCHDKTCVHTWAGLPTQCKSSGDCKGNVCLSGACVSEVCTYHKTQAKGCCDDHAACTTTKSCTLAECVARLCVESPVVGVGSHLVFGFDSKALDGWKVIKGNNLSYFHFQSADKVSGAGSMRYGVPGKVSIGAEAGNHGTATSPEFLVPLKKPSLRFEVYFDGNPISSVQRFGVQVLVGGETTEVWEKTKNLKGTTQQQWKTQEVSLGVWAGKKVRLRVYFSLKFITNQEDKKGLYFDLMEVRGQCP